MLLFSAPLDFDPEVWREYQAVTPAGAEVWVRDAITEWVCSPAENRYIGDAELAQYPNLRILATASTGTNHIDLDACKRRGIRVISLLDDRAGLETISASAEWTFKLILEGLRLKRPYHELQGRTVGLIGHGRIGRKIAKWSRAFGAEVDWYDPWGGDYMLTLGTMFFKDIVVICCALSEDTKSLIDYDLLKLLPKDAVLVNTARGEIINTGHLLKFMDERPDVRVCLDVVPGEVDGAAEVYRIPLQAAGAYVTPHIAGDTYESRTKAARIILGLLKSAREAENGAASPVAEGDYVR